MKSIISIILILTLSLLSITMADKARELPSDTKWTHQIEQGEDATSTHFYFYHVSGQSVDLVRWVWNGGAQNNPTVTEYRILAGKITIRHLVGKRESIPDLIAGRDAKLSLTHEHSITAKNIENLFLSATFKKPLTKMQKTDLKNLKDLLAEVKIGKKKNAESQ